MTDVGENITEPSLMHTKFRASHLAKHIQLDNASGLTNRIFRDLSYWAVTL